MHLSQNTETEITMALVNRRSLTSRQAMRKALKETTLASHFMVRFVEDQAVSVVSSKHIVEPPPTNLKVFDDSALLRPGSVWDAWYLLTT